MDDVRYAAAAGALATTRRGAWEGLPARAQLDAFLAPA
jgi:sugar/nucleoside kinase (ribokinase family)